jgi:hypothetical protein
VDRRQALETTLKAVALASVVSQGRALAQETAANDRTADGGGIYLHPVGGSEAAAVGAGLFTRQS